MRRKFVWTLIGALIALPIVAVVVGTKMSQFQSMAEAGSQFVMPPQPVNVLSVQNIEWHPRVSAVGSVAAVQGTVISTEAEGIVQKINFKPGSRVDAGDVLVELDSDVERAQLQAAEVDAEWAGINYRRSLELSKTRHISQAELDEASNSLKQAQAQVEYIRALMARKTIRAPFAGRLGILEISIGGYLSKGSPVVSLQAMDQVFVDFSLPQQYLGDLADDLDVQVKVDAYPNRPFTGRVTAINPQVDSDTRNVRVQATFDNPDGALRPGMFVSLDLVLARSQQALLIPATSVQYGPQGTSVFVVDGEDDSDQGNEKLVVRQQYVTLGGRRGDFVVVMDGLESGELVVSTGVFKLRAGMAVVIDNRLAPEFSLEPEPENT